MTYKLLNMLNFNLYLLFLNIKNFFPIIVNVSVFKYHLKTRSKETQYSYYFCRINYVNFLVCPNCCELTLFCN